MIFDPCSITMSLNGTNEAGVAVGTQTDLTGIHGFVMVPAPLIKNLPFDAIKVQLP